MKGFCTLCFTLGLIMPFVTLADQDKPPRNMGLQSDGELVQARAAKPGFKQAGHDTRQQQGRVLLDGDSNEARRHSIDLQNATVSSIRTESLNNSKKNSKKPQAPISK